MQKLKKELERIIKKGTNKEIAEAFNVLAETIKKEMWSHDPSCNCVLCLYREGFNDDKYEEMKENVKAEIEKIKEKRRERWKN